MTDENSGFAEWAKSFSGCDGGNPEAKTWLCGIEWGGSDKDDVDYYRRLPEDIRKGAVQPQSTYDWNYHLTYRYGRSFAKLYTAMQGRKVATYKESEHYRRNEIFKLNLYPIAFQSTDDQLWKTHGLDHVTGFAQKRLYQTWCMLHRFPFFSEQVRVYKPDVVIGTGVSYLSEFFLSFAQRMGERSAIHLEHLSSGKKKENDPGRAFYWANISDQTTLVVLPFFSGANGLNSDELLQEAGDRIRKIVGAGRA